MSHSVTTTASYIINKYSRSYPSTTSSLGAQAPVESEWQHFTNPIMKIILEARKSPSGQLVSMRLRMLWSLHAEPSDLQVDHREVVFEDLELLSFSSLPTLPTTVIQSDQSLPLKAVYRDAVVGIRYLHPRVVPPGAQPTYRRFQITFKDALDASQCIDAIKGVCPCKASLQPTHTHINRHATMLSTSLARTATNATGPGPSRAAHSVTSAGRHHTMAMASASVESRFVPPATLPDQPPENQAFLVAAPCSSMATNLSSDDSSAFVTCSEMSYRTETQTDRQKGKEFKKRGRNTAASSLPNSSQPSSSDQSVTMPPPPVPQRAMHATDTMIQEPSTTVDAGDERSQFLASLSEHPSLYELSRRELETLVSQVVREEGFLCLLESLDSLWRVKGFLGR